MARRATFDAVLDRMREICLALPDTKMTLTWGEPHFRVGEKIFAGCGQKDGVPSVGFKLTLFHQAAVVERPEFSVAPYVGKHGWVSMDASGRVDWKEVRSMVLESYGLIAPKRSLAKLEGSAPPARSPSARPRRKPAARRAPARKK